MMRLLVSMTLCWACIGGVGAQQTNWSGFYVSGGLGWTQGKADTSTFVAPGGSYFITTDPVQIAAAGAGNLSQDSLAGGIAAGWGTQFGRVLAGIEVSAHSLTFNESRSSGTLFLTFPAPFTVTQQVEADWMGTLRGRLGWAQDKWLGYVTGGLAVTRTTLSTFYIDSFAAGGVGGATGFSSTSKNRVGWTAGLGGEYALSRNWALRADYLYADFGKVTSGTVVFHPGNNQSSMLINSAELRTHTVLFGVSRHF